MVILLGALFYFSFHAFALEWYVGLLYKNPIERPYNFRKRWFFPFVAGISLLLFVASISCFALVKPVLFIFPFGGLICSTCWIRMRRGARMKNAIQAAVLCQFELSTQRVDQPTINREILRRLLGEESSGGWIAEVDVKTLLKCAVLPELGLYQVEEDFAQRERHPNRPTTGDLIDAMFDSFLKRMMLRSTR